MPVVSFKKKKRQTVPATNAGRLAKRSTATMAKKMATIAKQMISRNNHIHMETKTSCRSSTVGGISLILTS